MQYGSGENLHYRRCTEVAADVRMVFHCEIIFTGINRYSISSKGESLKMEKQMASGISEMVHPSTSLSSEWILTHSFYAKALAVKRVTSNKGKNTPGIDGVLWKTAKVKMQAIRSLRQHGYEAQLLRRIYIPKKNGKKRPLSIPTMYDRAMQALYKLALIPVAETTADRNSYGFRESRSCADAIAAAFNALAKPNSATWVLEGDITGCYDNIAKSWLIRNIPIRKKILLQWLNAGYVENNFTYPTRKGIPQGGIISPVLANMTLDSLGKRVLQSVPYRSKVNFIRYADDFIVTGKSRTILEKYVLPVIKQFLKERALELSESKTRITYIKEGFTFLGQTFRELGKILHITPAKEGVLALMRKVGMIIRKYIRSPLATMVKELNQTLRGWANYHRHIIASEAFSRVDNYVFDRLWWMLHKRHPKKSVKWLVQKYWNNNMFTITAKVKGKTKLYKVFRAGALGIRRHRKVKADANPYMPEYRKPFREELISEIY